jgi:hypothetical protein
MATNLGSGELDRLIRLHGYAPNNEYRAQRISAGLLEIARAGGVPALSNVLTESGAVCKKDRQANVVCEVTKFQTVRSSSVFPSTPVRTEWVVTITYRERATRVDELLVTVNTKAAAAE